MAITYAGRGKSVSSPITEWAISVHDMAYVYGDRAYEVEKTLRYLAKRKPDLQRFQSIFMHRYYGCKEDIVDALEHTALELLRA